MAKYEVKDINKNGKIDGWEQAKYDAINKAADSPSNMNYDSPAKQVDPMPMVPVRPANNVFSPQTQQVANQMYGEEIPGSYDRALPQGMYANAQEAITAKTNSRMAQALSGALSPFSKKGCKYKK